MLSKMGKCGGSRHVGGRSALDADVAWPGALLLESVSILLSWCRSLCDERVLDASKKITDCSMLLFSANTEQFISHRPSQTRIRLHPCG